MVLPVAQILNICNISVMVNRMRATRSHRGNRRSHHALTVVRFSKCKNCNALHQSHRVCINCGSYNGRKVIDMTPKKIKAKSKA
jgi:large subunit ribosomal protein L32